MAHIITGSTPLCLKSFGLLQAVFGGDFDRFVQRPIDGAVLGMNPMHTLNSLPSVSRCNKMIGDVNSPNHQDVVLGLDLSSNFRRQSFVAGVDLARFQRTPEGADQSAAGGRHHVIKCRGMRLCNLWANVIVFGHSSVYTEAHGF